MRPSFFMRVALVPKRVRQVLLAGILCLVFLSGGTFALAPAAHAGTNGQELEVYTSASSIHVVGYNQNGIYISQDCFPVVPYAWNYIYNWWWNGPIQIYTYYDSYCTYNPDYTGWETKTTVPGYQSGSDWWPVYVAPF